MEPQITSVPQPQPTQVPLRSKKWGYIVVGTICLVIASVAAFIGPMVVAFSAGGGADSFASALFIVTSIIVLFFLLGVWLVFKGLNTSMSADRKENENGTRYFLRISAYFVVAFVLSGVSVYFASSLITKFVYHGKGRLNLFYIGSFLIGAFVYYAFINKPWPISKKVGWILGTFVVLYVFLPNAPFIASTYIQTGKLPTPAEYNRVEDENAYMKSLFITDTSSFTIGEPLPLYPVIIDQPNTIKSYQAQIFEKDYSKPITYQSIHITQTSNLAFSAQEQKDLFGRGSVGYGGARYELNIDGQKVLIDESDSEPSQMITDIKWLSGNNFINVIRMGKFDPNTDEIVREVLKKYPSAW